MSQQRTAIFNGQDMDGPSRGSALDRSIDLTAVSWYTLGWVAVFVVGAGLRMIARTAWPLAASEARIATDALAFVRGETVSPDAAAHPLTTGLVSALFFLFGDSDGIARLLPLLAGLATLVLIFMLRGSIGRGPALAAGVIAAVSPTLVYISRTTGPGALLVALSLLLLLALLRQTEQPRATMALLVGAAAAGLILSGPVGWISLPLVFLTAWLIHAPSAGDGLRRALPLAALGFGATLVIVTTGFFTRPDGFVAFFRDNLGSLWDDYLSTLGRQWHLTLFQLVIDEPLLVILSLVAVVPIFLLNRDAEEPRIARAFALWAALSFLATTLLGTKNPEVYALTVLPMVFLAGLGLDRLISKITWAEVFSARGSVFLFTAALAILAILSTLGLLMGDIDDDFVVWIVKFLLVGICILAPLVALMIWLGRQIGSSRLAMIGLLGILVLAGLTIRSSVLFTYTTADRPAELLMVGDTAPAVRLMTERLTKISRDMTTYQQTVLDPTGGHGITIIIDDAIEQPFRWYFREFPNVDIVAPDQAPLGADEAHAIIARPDHTVLFQTGLERADRNYAYRLVSQNTLEDPNWNQLFRSVLNPQKWRAFAHFLTDRRVLAPSLPEQFTLSVRRDVGTRLYGQSPSDTP